jgi:hypothetical protein
MIELLDGKVGGGESPLRQQRTKNEDRLIAALNRFGDVDARPVS